MDVDIDAVIDLKKTYYNNVIFKNLSKVTEEESWSKCSTYYNSTLKNGATLNIKRGLEGYNIKLSEPRMYLKNDAEGTIMSIDRLMYYLDVISSEMALELGIKL